MGDTRDHEQRSYTAPRIMSLGHLTGGRADCVADGSADLEMCYQSGNGAGPGSCRGDGNSAGAECKDIGSFF